MLSRANIVKGSFSMRASLIAGERGLYLQCFPLLNADSGIALPAGM